MNNKLFKILKILGIGFICFIGSFTGTGFFTNSASDYQSGLLTISEFKGWAVEDCYFKCDIPDMNFFPNPGNLDFSAFDIESTECKQACLEKYFPLPRLPK